MTGISVDNMQKRVDLVFEGGGVKGIALVGALTVIEENQFEIKYRAGTSAGAIVVALSAAGYTGNEIREIILKQDFKRFMDSPWVNRFPRWLSWPISILKNLGVFQGNYLLKLMEKKTG